MISEIITAALFLVNYHYVESGTNPFTIFGGNDTNIQTYKFLVDVQWHGTHCGGCIISHALVMTVAHCVHGVNRGYIHVHIGSSSPVPGPAGLSIGISEILEHPDYNYATDANDISLLRLRRNLTYGDNIGAVHLPRENEMLLRPDTVIRAIGFGVMRNGSYTQLLTEGYLWIVKYIRCEDAYGITFVSQICAKNEDITLGERDEGSPVLYGNQLIGIVSFTAESRDPGGLTVLVRVPDYLEFILPIINITG